MMPTARSWGRAGCLHSHKSGPPLHRALSQVALAVKGAPAHPSVHCSLRSCIPLTPAYVSQSLPAHTHAHALSQAMPCSPVQQLGTTRSSAQLQGPAARALARVTPSCSSWPHDRVHALYCPGAGAGDAGNLICTSEAAADAMDARPRSPSLLRDAPTRGAARAPALPALPSACCFFLRRMNRNASNASAATAAMGTATAGAMMPARLLPPSSAPTSQVRDVSLTRRTKPRKQFCLPSNWTAQVSAG
mmetsp:Transcript_25638/g.65093  ORF Transcript_25638/g.65093 Transcript_25638/m.65093 type:complete len:247 (-) Transcript_25638:919-1659(-)